MKTSCINHPPDSYFIKIHDWQIELMGGDRIAAALLSFFEFNHNSKLNNQPKAVQLNKVAEMHGDAPTQDTTLYQWHTEAELEKGIKIGKRTAIAASMKKLVEMGFVSIHRNPNPKYTFDKTRHFLFYPEKVNAAIARLIDNAKVVDDQPNLKTISESSSTEFTSSSLTSDLRSPENELAIPKNSSKNSTKNSSKKNKRPPNPQSTGGSVIVSEENPIALENPDPIATEQTKPENPTSSTLALIEKENVPPREPGSLPVIKTVEDVAIALDSLCPALKKKESVKNQGDAFEMFCKLFRESFKAAAPTNPASPGDTVRMAKEWDLLFKGTKDPVGLAKSIVEGTEAYWENKKATGDRIALSGYVFLKTGAWNQALEDRHALAASKTQSAQKFAPFLTCFNQERPLTWPEADESDLSPRAIARLEQLSSKPNSIERFQKALLWCKRNPYWGLQRSETFGQFLDNLRIDDFAKNQIHHEALGLDKTIAPTKQDIESASIRHHSRVSSIRMFTEDYRKGEYTLEEFRKILTDMGVDPNSVPDAR